MNVKDTIASIKTMNSLKPVNYEFQKKVFHQIYKKSEKSYSTDTTNMYVQYNTQVKFSKKQRKHKGKNIEKKLNTQESFSKFKPTTKKRLIELNGQECTQSNEIIEKYWNRIQREYNSLNCELDINSFNDSTISSLIFETTSDDSNLIAARKKKTAILRTHDNRSKFLSSFSDHFDEVSFLNDVETSMTNLDINKTNIQSIHRHNRENIKYSVRKQVKKIQKCNKKEDIKISREHYLNINDDSFIFQTKKSS